MCCILFWCFFFTCTMVGRNSLSRRNTLLIANKAITTQSNLPSLIANVHCNIFLIVKESFSIFTFPYCKQFQCCENFSFCYSQCIIIQNSKLEPLAWIENFHYIYFWQQQAFNSWSACHDNWCFGTLLNRTIAASWEGMGDVGSARYEPALLPPCPTIRVLSYSNCQRSTHSISKWIFRNLAL